MGTMSVSMVWPSLIRSRKSGSLAAAQGQDVDRLPAVVDGLVGADEELPVLRGRIPASPRGGRFGPPSSVARTTQ